MLGLFSLGLIYFLLDSTNWTTRVRERKTKERQTDKKNQRGKGEIEIKRDKWTVGNKEKGKDEERKVKQEQREKEVTKGKLETDRQKR